MIFPPLAWVGFLVEGVSWVANADLLWLEKLYRAKFFLKFSRVIG